MPIIHNWSVHLISALNKLYPEKQYNKLNCLEVGSFEGNGSIIIHDRLCNNADSKLYCIDPWDDVYIKNNDLFTSIDHYFNNQYNRFIENTKIYTKIIPVRGYSDDILVNNIPALNIKFDFAFIDGDHTPAQVYKDCINVLKNMNVNGIIIMDDYLWEHNGIKCREGIDKFISDYSKYITVIDINTYAIVKVIANLE